MTYRGQVELWDAINAVVAASGGRSNTSVARQKAVADVERAVSAIIQSVAKRLRSAELLIDECADALAEYEDTHDGDGGRPIANRAMQARTSIEEWRSYR